MQHNQAWSEWQQQVVAVIRSEYLEVLRHVDENDIDWDAWRPMFEEGRSARAAVDRAFVKDLYCDVE